MDSGSSNRVGRTQTKEARAAPGAIVRLKHQQQKEILNPAHLKRFLSFEAIKVNRQASKDAQKRRKKLMRAAKALSISDLRILLCDKTDDQP